MEDACAHGSWQRLAQAALKGAPLSTVDVPLAPLTGGDTALSPFHLAAPSLYAGRATTGPWVIVQRVDTNTDAASAGAVEDLVNGATGLCLVFAGAPSAFGRGLTVNQVDGLGQTLDGVKLDLVPVWLDAGAAGRSGLALILALGEVRGTLPKTIHAGIDPIGAAAFAGTQADMSGIVEVLKVYDAHALAGAPFRTDGRIAHEAGATPSDELAFAAANLLGLLDALHTAGIGPEQALPRIEVALSADQDQFATIAKLRAMRRLHALIADACCGAPPPLHLSVTTSARMLAYRDPHTNLLRLTIAAMAAVQGGADALTVLPFDAGASRFARRMSRNIQSLMLDEAHLSHINDPGAGSGTIETLTEALAQSAWETVQAHAGADSARWLTDGTFARRAALNAARRTTIIGVTKHPPKDPAPFVMAAPVAPRPVVGALPTSAPIGALIARAKSGEPLDLTVPQLGRVPLVPARAATPFEG